MRTARTCAAAVALACAEAIAGDAAVPGETEAARIETIYYEQGPRQALQALARDYRDALGGSDAEGGRSRIEAEISRLEAHTTRYAQYSPLAAIATQWCLDHHAPDDFPLHYNELLPAEDAAPGATAADVALDREMVNVLQINWVNYADLTRTRTHGYVVDEQQIELGATALSKDLADQEDVRAAAAALSQKRVAKP
jgi:hypothetical protein